MNFRKAIRRILWLPFLAVDLDPRQVLRLRNLLRYRRELRAFRRAGGAVARYYPVLDDYDKSAGSARGHYFHQDLLVASEIFRAAPRRHLDVGSRVDGFVAHVASFRVVEVMDVRSLGDSGHPHIKFVQADLMDDASTRGVTADSVSCLHALEHFGLGRYGDPIDPEGHHKGFANLVAMVEPGGVLYVSFPIGRATEVHFNAHRVFEPAELLSWLHTHPDMQLHQFDYVDDDGALHRSANPLVDARNLNYGCGIYTLRRKV